MYQSERQELERNCQYSNEKITRILVDGGHRRVQHRWSCRGQHRWLGRRHFRFIYALHISTKSLTTATTVGRQLKCQTSRKVQRNDRAVIDKVYCPSGLSFGRIVAPANLSGVGYKGRQGRSAAFISVFIKNGQAVLLIQRSLVSNVVNVPFTSFSG